MAVRALVMGDLLGKPLAVIGQMMTDEKNDPLVRVVGKSIIETVNAHRSDAAHCDRQATHHSAGCGPCEEFERATYLALVWLVGERQRADGRVR